MDIDPDHVINEDPYAFTWAYPVLALSAFAALWFEQYAIIAGCVAVAGLIAFSMGLHLRRHLLPLDWATVHRDESPRLYWAYTAMQGGVVVIALAAMVVILSGVLE